jgi:hypothetical protein
VINEYDSSKEVNEIDVMTRIVSIDTALDE